MKISDLQFNLKYHTDELVIVLPKGQHHQALALIDGTKPIIDSKEYDIIIKPHRQKRSLDANAYCWTLIRKLAEHQKIKESEVYREYIKDCGVSTIVPIREDAIKVWIENWESRGIGWVCDDMGECRNTEGYHNIKCYYGSSTYDSEQMARLIDAIIFDAGQAGIETMPKDKLEQLKEEWGQ